MKIIITGFDPFGGESINPAYEVLKLLPKEIDKAKIMCFELPTVFGKSLDFIKDLIHSHEPQVLLHVGQAGGRYDITPERIAINYDDARIKDNEGNQPLAPILQGAPAAYFSTLPIKYMVQFAKSKGVPASVSNTAGTFVCNHVMYGSLHFAKEYNDAKGFTFMDEGFLRSGFVHVPFLNEQVLSKQNTPFMDINLVAKGLLQMIKACILHKDDLLVNAGEIC